ncbi:MAG: hypothetical protein EI684_12385 [Candidatus Viridilinea halotolerans]|uniref:Uncharacterized protein n=1 Tax=Candidatus Viridilinea halotolerans TaxID=2491704 RepID=A0A426TY94_9CHLR|nr:MAG: hypothetical protein EI684_12385 [Candidatus Viridilinea halotolerans]
MSVMQRSYHTTSGHTHNNDRLEGVYKVTEAFRSIAMAWESIAVGSWSPATIQSFAALARRVALDLSTLGCGALDKGVVDLVLALDTITVTGNVGEAQLRRVDQALASLRAITTQRLLAMDLATVGFSGGEAPMVMHESCPRCAASGVCTISRGRCKEREREAGF